MGMVDSQGYCSRNTGNTRAHKMYMFTGKPFSASTGVYYHYLHRYDSSIGSFISQDPLPGFVINPRCLDLYAYVADFSKTERSELGKYGANW